MQFSIEVTPADQDHSQLWLSCKKYSSPCSADHFNGWDLVQLYEELSGLKGLQQFSILAVTFYPVEHISIPSFQSSDCTLLL
jgi:hypothetical protein